MTLKTTWILINYNNLKEIHRLVNKYGEIASIIVVDNSGEYKPLKNEKVYSNNDNLGYIGGFQFALKQLENSPTKIILSNSDIEIIKPSNIFHCRMDKEPKIIAPLIENLNGNMQNPHLIERPSKNYYRFRKLFSSSIYLWSFWGLFVSLKRNFLQKKEMNGVSNIYAGHGSFVIFENVPKNYLVDNSFNFLFGEEIHFAEIARNFNIPVKFDKDIVIKHFEHTSTNSIKEAVKAKFYHQSYIEILKKYY